MEAQKQHTEEKRDLQNKEKELEKQETTQQDGMEVGATFLKNRYPMGTWVYVARIL